MSPWLGFPSPEHLDSIARIDAAAVAELMTSNNSGRFALVDVRRADATVSLTLLLRMRLG